MQHVPFLDLSSTHTQIHGQLVESAERVIASGQFVLGTEVSTFEQRWAEFCGVRNAVSVGSGLDALYFALRALGVGKGDEVLVPANTFIATWFAVEMCGARPIPVEPDSGSYNISIENAKQKFSSKTVALIVVHLYGQPADLDSALEFCNAMGIPLVEDAAQAHGARYRGTRIGGHGAAVAWSFYPGKNLGALGDGGAVTTNNDLLAESIFTLRNYGSKKKYEHEVIGINSRLDEIQAAFLLEKLKYLDNWNSRRRQIAERYLIGLEPLLHLPQLLGRPALVALPQTIDAVEPVWHLFVVRVRERAEFIHQLRIRGVETSIHYPTPPAEQPAFSEQGLGGPNLFSSTSSREVVSLPMGPHLTDSQVEWVIASVNQVCTEGTDNP